MSMVYTVIIAAKRPIPGKPELWDIISKRDFGHPKSMRSHLNNSGLLFNNLPPFTNIKVEIHEGGISNFDVSRKPLMLVRAILPGKTIYRPCIKFPNGNMQDFRDFLAHWQQMLIPLYDTHC